MSGFLVLRFKQYCGYPIMLNACGEMEAPSREAAAAEVSRALQETRPGDHLVLCKKTVDGLFSLGSYACWHAVLKKEVLANVAARLDAMEPEEYIRLFGVDQYLTTYFSFESPDYRVWRRAHLLSFEVLNESQNTFLQSRK